MAAPVTPHRWTLTEFLLAWEAGAIGKRVELIDGQVWDVAMGPWHGEVTMRVARALPNDRFRITAASLPTGESLPEPDCWVLRKNAEPVAHLSRRMPRWAADDVLLVVEVSDETLEHDLGRKSVLYAQAGFAHYWSVTRVGVYHHSQPTPAGYGNRVLHHPSDRLAVPYADGVTLDVGSLIAE